MSDADYAAEQREGRIRVELELTPAQHAAASTLAEGDLAAYLAQLPVEAARERRDRADEERAWNIHTEGLLVAAALTMRAFADALGWDQQAVLDQIAAANAGAGTTEQAELLEQLLLASHVAAEQVLVNRYGQPAPAVSEAQRRIVRRFDDEFLGDR